jgi:hypothetical protein
LDEQCNLRVFGKSFSCFETLPKGSHVTGSHSSHLHGKAVILFFSLATTEVGVKGRRRLMGVEGYGEEGTGDDSDEAEVDEGAQSEGWGSEDEGGGGRSHSEGAESRPGYDVTNFLRTSLEGWRARPHQLATAGRR